jgi:hypothetical protein
LDELLDESNKYSVLRSSEQLCFLLSLNNYVTYFQIQNVIVFAEKAALVGMMMWNKQ